MNDEVNLQYEKYLYYVAGNLAFFLPKLGGVRMLSMLVMSYVES